MVVLAASITTTSGRPLLSRQFKDLSKDRVLELLSKFQNLVSTISSDHTFVEDNHVRYVYKPFDDYYIILITNRQSNIIQDLSTLNLFSQTINSYLTNFDELEIFDNAFEILSSFDEIICMGYKENLSYNQVNTYLAMESHEERIQDIIERNKELEATEERKRRAKEIARKEQERKNGIISPDNYNINPNAPNKFQSSNDPNVASAYNSYYSHASAAAQKSYMHPSQQTQPQQQYMYSNSDTTPRSGMKLSAGGRNTDDIMRKNYSSNFQTNSTSTKNKVSYFDDSEPKPENNGILISINETINAEFNRDGSIQSSELKGVLEVRVNNTELSDASIQLVDTVNVKDRAYQFKTHPNIDKAQFLKSKIISLKDKSKSFPHNDQSLGVLRWRKVSQTDDRSLVPLELSTWVSIGSEPSTFDVTIEFALNQDFSDIKVEDLGFIIPIPTNSIKINEDSNEFKARVVDVNDEVGIVIKLDSSIEAEQQGSFSFLIQTEMEDTLFPINTSFKIKDKSLSGVNIKAITKVSDDTVPYDYDLISTLKTDEYTIV